MIGQCGERGEQAQRGVTGAGIDGWDFYKKADDAGVFGGKGQGYKKEAIYKM